MSVKLAQVSCINLVKKWLNIAFFPQQHLIRSVNNRKGHHFHVRIRV